MKWKEIENKCKNPEPPDRRYKRTCECKNCGEFIMLDNPDPGWSHIKIVETPKKIKKALGREPHSWAYGLVEEPEIIDKERYSKLSISEVHFSGKTPKMYSGVDWEHFRENRGMILKDIESQTKYGIEFYVDKKNRIQRRMSRMKRCKEARKGGHLSKR